MVALTYKPELLLQNVNAVFKNLSFNFFPFYDVFFFPQGSHIVWLWALKSPRRHTSPAGPSCTECGWDVSNYYQPTKWTKGNDSLIYNLAFVEI